MSDFLHGMSLADLEVLRDRVANAIEIRRFATPWHVLSDDGTPVNFGEVWYVHASGYTFSTTDGLHIQYAVGRREPRTRLSRDWLTQDAEYTGFDRNHFRAILALIYDANRHMVIDR